jgi:hypothetical protein
MILFFKRDLMRLIYRSGFIQALVIFLFILNTFFPTVSIIILSGMQVFSSDLAYSAGLIWGFFILILYSGFLAYLMTRATKSYKDKDLFKFLGIALPILNLPLGYFLWAFLNGEFALAITVSFLGGIFITLVGSPAISILIFCNLWLGKEIFKTFNDQNHES